MSVEPHRRPGTGRLRPRRPGRRVALPVRRTDRVEDLAAWLLTALGLLAVLGAVAVGRAAHDAALAPDAVAVRAVLLVDVPSTAQVQRAPRAAPRVPVTWTTDGGTPQTGLLTVRGVHPAGTTVAAWADPQGRLTTAPPSRGPEAAAFGLAAALAAGAAVWGVLLLLWSAVRRSTSARNEAAWAREWARVEPLWSRRVR
jgi:hypothetical protein